MKTFITSLLLAGLLLVLGCDDIVPKASNIQLDVNGTQLSSAPYDTDGSVLVDVGVSESASIAEQEAAMDTGPWYIWPSGQNLLVVSTAGPGTWDDSCGLYETSASMEGTKMRLRIGAKLAPAAEDGKVMTYDWDAMASNGLTGGVILVVKTPYKKGGYLISIHQKLMMVPN